MTALLFLATIYVIKPDVFFATSVRDVKMFISKGNRQIDAR